MPKKVGPNREDENRILEWYHSGKVPSQISDLLQIEQQSIEIFLDSWRSKNDPDYVSADEEDDEDSDDED